jgi:hypothetical protein
VELDDLLLGDLDLLQGGRDLLPGEVAALLALGYESPYLVDIEERRLALLHQQRNCLMLLLRQPRAPSRRTRPRPGRVKVDCSVVSRGGAARG